MMMNFQISNEKLELLRAVPTFGAWLESGDDHCREHLARGEEVRLEAGQWLVKEGEPAAFFLLLEGELRVLKTVGDAEMLLTTHKPGTFFGEIPLILGTPFVAGGQAREKARVFRLDEAAFWSLFASCPTIAREIAKTMAFRMQNLESLSQTREKLVALGTLAAGLAHELNNPASAAKRASSLLRETMREVENRAIALHGLGFEPSQCDLIRQTREEAYELSLHPQNLSAMARSDAEDELADWLEMHDISEGFHLAPTLVSAGITADWLQKLAAQVNCAALAGVVSWLEASLRADGLAGEIEKSSDVISRLVADVKGYSHLDEAPQQSVDLAQSLDATLSILRFALRGIEIEKNYAPDLPPLWAHGGELNQVWTNLLDNAADALKPDGENPKKGAKISLCARPDAHRVIVEIADNGPGIPEDVKNRIFEPFFTTKGVGSGTGLGLDIAHRIVVGRHGGDISLESSPDGTKFTISLPMIQEK